MTKREKILAISVGVLALFIFSIYSVNELVNAFDQRQDTIFDLESDLAKQNRAVARGKIAKKDFDALIEKSLPSDPTFANSIYQTWLLDRAVEVGLASVKVTPMTSGYRGDLYYEHSFLLSGRGDFAQLTELLHRFYSTDFLHRIGRLHIKPIQDSKQLDFSITAEGLSLAAAPPKRPLVERPAARLAESNIDEYREAIAVRRNLFAPANKPPKFVALRTQQAFLNRSFTFTAKADDEDKDDQVTYAIHGESPEGARIEAQSGRVSWTPTELGEYEFAIEAIDSGVPPGRDLATIKIAVVEPPAEQPVAKGPEFDPATQAIVTGITGIGDRREVWLTIRTEGRVVKLQVGDEVNVGTFTGVVNQIRDREAEIKTDEGKTVIVSLGKSLIDPTLGGL